MCTIDLDIVLNTEIGIMPSEQGRQQTLTVHLGVDLEPKATLLAGQSGRIDQTLDYGDLRAIVLEVFSERRFNLLEEPALLIKERALKLPLVQAIRVSIAKQHPWPDVPFVKVSL